MGSVTVQRIAPLSRLCFAQRVRSHRFVPRTTITPAARLAEFLGLWTFAVRLAPIIGPIIYGLVTWLTDNNHRLAILTTGSFFCHRAGAAAAGGYAAGNRFGLAGRKSPISRTSLPKPGG